MVSLSMFGWLLPWLKVPDEVKATNENNDVLQGTRIDELANLLESGQTDTEALIRIADLLGQNDPR